MSIGKWTRSIIISEDILDNLHGRVPDNHKKYLSIFHKQYVMFLKHTSRKLDIFDQIIFYFVDSIVKVLRKGFHIFIYQFEEFVMIEVSFVYFLFEEMAVEEIMFPVFGEDYAVTVLIDE